MAGRAIARIETVCKRTRPAAACGRTRTHATEIPEPAAASSDSAATGAGAAGWAGSEAGSAAGAVSIGAGVPALEAVVGCATNGGD
jgi:hypothetical protein